MNRFLLPILLSSLVGCDTVELGDTAPGFEDTAGEVLDTAASDSAIDTSIDDSEVPVESVPGVDSADTSIDDSGLDDDCTFEVQGADGPWYEVGSYLVFSLDVDSASGLLEPGSDEIITINASAACGDIVLEHVFLDLSGTDVEDVRWIDDINNVVSGVCYDWDDMGHFEGFGLCSSRPVDLYDDGYGATAIWSLTFAVPVFIPKDETFSFSLQVRMGGTDGLQPSVGDVFRAELEEEVAWYGVDDPDAYPESSIMEPVIGNSLMLAE